MKNKPWTILAFASIFSILLIQLSLSWEWSILMDDRAYLQWMPKVSNFSQKFFEEIKFYWNQGRFTPIKCAANLLKWRYLPLQPGVFHFFDLVLFFGTLLIGISAVQLKENKIFFLGIAILQRPLLDALALTTIAEPWVILFIALGLFSLNRNKWIYRLFFILAAGSKEPASLVFFASALYHLLNYKNKKSILNSLFDFVIFIILIFIAWKAKNSGPYLQEYNLISIATLKSFLMASIKVLVGVVPFTFLINWKLKWTRFELFCLFFSIPYLYLASARSNAGYLLIPSAFVLFLLFASKLDRSESLSLTTAKAKISYVIFILVLITSLYRYSNFAFGINESTRALLSLIRTNEKLPIHINSEEAAFLANEEAIRSKSLANFLFLNPLQNVNQKEILIFELSATNGKIEKKNFNSLQLEKTGKFSAYKIFKLKAL